MTIVAEQKPILYFDEVNPQSRSCLVLIKYLNIDVELHYVDLCAGEQLSSAYTKLNPARTVPILVKDNFILSDSHTILMFLCDVYNESNGQELYPREFAERLKVINKLFFESNVLFRRHNEFMTDIVRKTLAGIDFKYHYKKIIDAYDTLEEFLSDSSYIAGEVMTIADISYITTVSGLNILLPIEQTKWPHLCGWFERLDHSTIGLFNASGVEKQRQIIEEVGKFRSVLTIKRSVESFRLPDLRSIAVSVSWRDLNKTEEVPLKRIMVNQNNSIKNAVEHAAGEGSEMGKPFEDKQGQQKTLKEKNILQELECSLKEYESINNKNESNVNISEEDPMKSAKKVESRKIKYELENVVESVDMLAK